MKFFSIMLTVVGLLYIANGMPPVPNSTSLPAYAETAFPVQKRDSVKREFKQRLQAARSRAEWMDQRIANIFGPLPDDTIQKIRITKRQELRNRLLAFIENNLSREDATGLGFAEQGLADTIVFEETFEDEIKNWANYPRRENNPTVLNVKDFGARGDGTGDDRLAFERANDAIRALGGRPSILRIPTGTYRMGSSRVEPSFVDSRGDRVSNPTPSQCIFSRLENCIIEGDGPDKTRILCGVFNAAQVTLSHCRNVTLRRLEIRLEKTPFMEGTITAFDPKTGTCELELKPGTISPDDPCWTEMRLKHVNLSGCAYDEKGIIVQNARIIPWLLNARSTGENIERKSEGTFHAISMNLKNAKPTKFQKISGNHWRFLLARDTHPEFFDRFVKNLRVGWRLVWGCRYNLFRGAEMRYSSYCTFEDIWVRNSRASAFNIHSSRSATLYRCRLFPVEGLTMSSVADACFTSPGAFLYQCSFDSMGDDGFNVNRVHAAARTQKQSNELAHPSRGINLGGELVCFANYHSGQYLGNRTLAATDSISNLPEGRMRVSRFTQPVGAEFNGSIFYEPRQQGIGTIISDCSWSNGRLAGCVLQSPNVILENTRFVNIFQGVRLGALGDYYEGPPPYNVLVRNCNFKNLQEGLTCWIRMMAPKGGFETVRCAPIRALEVVDNTFTAISRCAVDIKHTGDSKFARNIFKQVAKDYSFSTCEEITRE